MSDGPNDMARAERVTDPRDLRDATALSAAARQVLARNASIREGIVSFAETLARIAIGAGAATLPGGATVQTLAREVATMAIEQAAAQARRG